MPHKWKECSVCHKLLKLEQFWKRSRNSDGRQAQCRDCIKTGDMYDRSLERCKKYKRTRAKQALSGLKWKAKKLGLPFDLTEEWLSEKFLSGICEATGMEIDNSEYAGSEESRDMVPTVDRIEPALGYVQSNCRVVSYKFNLMRNKWPDEDFIRMGELTKKHLEFLESKNIKPKKTKDSIDKSDSQL